MMFYLLLRVTIFVLYILGIVIVYAGYVPTFLTGIYGLVFIAHVVHLIRFQKEYGNKLGTILILDILLFGMVPILEIRKAQS